MTNERKYLYEGEEILVSSEYTPVQVREIWSEVYAGIANAEIRENDDGSVTFVKTGGTKGN
jgi:PRTRC genetic system protein C